MTKKEQMISYLRGKKFPVYESAEYINDCRDNLEQITSNNNQFCGCPQNYGLSEAKAICEDEDDSKLTQKEILDSCKECWRLALLDDYVDESGD